MVDGVNGTPVVTSPTALRTGNGPTRGTGGFRLTVEPTTETQLRPRSIDNIELGIRGELDLPAVDHHHVTIEELSCEAVAVLTGAGDRLHMLESTFHIRSGTVDMDPLAHVATDLRHLHAPTAPWGHTHVEATQRKAVRRRHTRSLRGRHRLVGSFVLDPRPRARTRPTAGAWSAP